MVKVYCFLGKPGCGKSSLLTSLNVPYWDILEYLTPFLQGQGGVREEKTFAAYRALFHRVAQCDQQKLFLEVGTNHPEFVVSQLAQYDSHLFFCLLDKATCWQRALQRGRKFASEPLLRRLNNNFPQEHLQILKSSHLPHSYLDMQHSLAENVEMIRQTIGLSPSSR